jgi:hypothetical protein
MLVILDEFKRLIELEQINKRNFMKLATLLILGSVSASIYAADPVLEAERKRCRRGIMSESTAFADNKWFSPIQANDRAEDLVDEPHRMVRSIKQMAEMKLHKAKTKETPWSDSYWPLNSGGLAQRYGEEKFPAIGWKSSRDYVMANPAEVLVSEGRWHELSPAEKYDLLMDLRELPLTNVSWNDGKYYWDRFGKVETWMGLCHGWAAAAMMMPEPKKNVEIEVASGKALFYPSDIKGLATLLWSKGSFPTRFIGGRCNIRRPQEDDAGRPIERDCLDTNPGTWHLAVVNQLGVSKRPLIMDAAYDYEVWNQPVFTYEYMYYHPQTKKRTRVLEEAMVPVSELEDARARFRARKTDFIVGVVMGIRYAVENHPNTLEHQEVLSTFVEYEYDLELDPSYNIIGGEWYSSNRPDFLWVPDTKAFPRTQGDNGMDFDFIFTALSPNVKRNAAINAAQGLPWGPVVRDLFRRSSR